jgi:hypothetical protein
MGSPHSAHTAGPFLGAGFVVAFACFAGRLAVAPSARVTVTSEAGGTS